MNATVGGFSDGVGFVHDPGNPPTHTPDEDDDVREVVSDGDDRLVKCYGSGNTN